uniref:Conserved oligomeric Golgi complex subunit 7 n=1 Tax=Timema poppense TaxID=170557 RepID=A0A7R9HG76_TIMPO|nr:unnamed protein product [Timema poppensis]
MSLLEFIALPLKKLCSDVHHTTFQVIFAPISSQLDLVQSAPAWSATSKQAVTVTPDLPDFSYVPQEYITQPGNVCIIQKRRKPYTSHTMMEKTKKDKIRNDVI